MKKVIAIVTVAALAACSTPNNEASEVVTDSTAVDSTCVDSLCVDTTTVITVDSTIN